MSDSVAPMAKKKKAQPWAGPENAAAQAAAAPAPRKPSTRKGIMSGKLGKGGKGGKGGRKPRHATRRQRFRQGMWNAGHGMGALDEEREEDGDLEVAEMEMDDDDDDDDGQSRMERTCAMTQATGDDMKSQYGGFDKENSSIFSSRLCQCSLLVVLLGVAAFAIVLVVSGGFDGLMGKSSSEETTVLPEEEAPQDPRMEWFFEPDLIAVDTEPSPTLELLPNFTLQALQEMDSPQSLALEFVDNHPDVETMPNWKKLQIFAMVSFYHAFNGDEWDDEKREGWLDYELDECDWGDPGKELSYLGVSCTEIQQDMIVNGTDATRRITNLNLDWFLGFGKAGYPETEQNVMPPEVVFLTELETLGMNNAALFAYLDQLLPPTLRQLENLKRLSFALNSIQGTIPSYLGEFSHLEILELRSNKINGTLPSQMGGLSNLVDLQFQSNQLSGSIPYNWHKMTELRHIWGLRNQLTGSVPSFVGDWTHLKEFYMDHNDMRGDLPQSICALPDIEKVFVPCGVNCGENCDVCECS